VHLRRVVRPLRAIPAGIFRAGRRFPQARFAWLDTEDDADRVGDLEIENFPTIVVRRGAQTLFCGPQPPSHDLLKRLLEELLRER